MEAGGQSGSRQEAGGLQKLEEVMETDSFPQPPRGTSLEDTLTQAPVKRASGTIRGALLSAAYYVSGNFTAALGN